MATFKRNADTKEKQEHIRQDRARRNSIYAMMEHEGPSDRARELFRTPAYYTKKGMSKK